MADYLGYKETREYFFKAIESPQRVLSIVLNGMDIYKTGRIYVFK